jgi:uroporphyrinogen decarboxylase
MREESIGGRIGDRVCMIGGFDQFHFFAGCTAEETRAEVRRCFEAAGAGGGFILSPSDHFFEADLALLEAFADDLDDGPLFNQSHD